MKYSLGRPNARFGLRQIKNKIVGTLTDLYDRIFDKAYYTKKKMSEIGDQDNTIPSFVEENPYDKYGYIGGGTREVRQKYFNIDKEFTDSVKSISKRYGLRPEVVASRLAEEGPIDRGINMYNGDRPDFNRGTLLSSPNVKMIGPTWGLDDVYTDLLKGNVQFTTQTPYDYYDIEFDNEKGRRTYSIESPQWWLGIEGNAAELKYHRDKFKQQFPNISDADLDAAAAMSFNMGTTGAKNFYKNKGYIPKRYYPYIKMKEGGATNHTPLRYRLVDRREADVIDLRQNRPSFVDWVKEIPASAISGITFNHDEFVPEILKTDRMKYIDYLNKTYNLEDNKKIKYRDAYKYDAEKRRRSWERNVGFNRKHNGGRISLETL